MLVTLVIGTAFYMGVERLSGIDAFYLSGSTLTTLGYGDFVPVTDAGKIFTVFYSLAGIGIIFYGLASVFHFVFIRSLIEHNFHIKRRSRRRRK